MHLLTRGIFGWFAACWIFIATVVVVFILGVIWTTLQFCG